MKIEQFSSLNVKGHRNILSQKYSRLHCLVTLAQIVEGKKLIEPAEVSIEKKKIKHISWIKNTLVFTMRTSGNALSVISTYLTLHIQMRIHWIMHTLVNCSSRTNNCLLYK
jgi:hypothetical protein